MSFIKDIFEGFSIKDIAEKIGDSNINFKNKKDLESITKVFDFIEYAPKKFLEYIGARDNFLDSFIAYRIPKAIVGSVFNTLFELDNVAVVSNQDVKSNDLTLNKNHSKQGYEFKEDNPRCLVFSNLSHDMFKFIKGIEFDLDAQIRFMKLFDSAYGMLSSEEENEDKTKTDLGNKLANFFPNKSLPDDIIEKLIALNKIKNKLTDQGLKKLAGENVGRNLKKYSYVEYEIKTTVSLINIGSNENKKFINTEALRCWYDFDSDYIPGKNELTICDKWKPRYEHRTIEDAGVINIEKSHLVSIEVEISRTTGIQELVKKGLAQLQEEKLIQKAGGAQWGAAGAEAGAIADKLLITFLKSRYESDPVLPNENLKFLLYDGGLSKTILNSYKKKYPTNSTEDFSNLKSLDINLSLPLTDKENITDGISSESTQEKPPSLEFIKISELKSKSS